MNKFNKKGTKPLATKKGQKLFPICYVDSSVRTSGRPLRACDIIIGTSQSEKKVVEDEDLAHQTPLAASQWGNPNKKFEEPWIRSWFFPLDAFNPWPKRTDISCWWCTYPFDWTPFPLPYQYDVSSNRYRTVGMFCGPSCAKTYAAKMKAFPNLDSVFSFIETVAEDFYGYILHVEDGAPKRSAIPFAPEKEILQRFCGPEGFTIEQYRNACACGRDIRLLPPMWITMKQVVQAEQRCAKVGKKRIFHKENPDDIQRTHDLVKVHRIPFAGLGARRMTDYLRQKS